MTKGMPIYLQPRFLAALVLLLTIAKLLAAGFAYFVEDEAYYRLWGLYPALSYYDHPPMIGWWIWAGQQVFGDTTFATRVLVVLSSAIGSLVLWRTARILFDKEVAGWAVLFFNTSILVGVGGILATPDAPSVFFWGLSLWALAELSTSKNANWLLAIGLFAGLGLASKYSVLFLGAGIVLWLLWVPENRRWFGAWQLWVGGLIAIACFSPVLYWNHIHDWASFHKQFGRVSAGGYTTKYIFEFIGAVLGLVNPLIAILAIAGAGVLGKRALRKDNAPALLVLTVLPFVMYLTYHSLTARVQGNWPAPLFPAFALMAAVFVASRPGSSLWSKLGAAGAALGIVVALVVQVHAVSPLTGTFARKDPTFQLRGWDEIGRKLERIAVDTGADYIITTGYGLNAQLHFLQNEKRPVIQINKRLRYIMMPEPSLPEGIRNFGLYVTEARRDRSATLSEFYTHVEPFTTLTREVEGTFLEEIRVYLVSGQKKSPLTP
ncbi:glycosyl transferase family protein [Roseibium sp. TrichSKD4]|uniref:ArnT family glycosyltransferase n=1 Tax=Roseibium sp. TrichSKD4 TaxID=744980 RepID=UPI0001E562FB|nr:glycosyltransferase family 39 protein [Roseibium sp. TrichSKD4]EFO34546.1 glycosyl transferase family protein [Roseibium sp. TrichSKD4]